MKKIFIPLLIVWIIFFSFFWYLNRNYETPIFMYHSLDPERIDNYAAVAPDNFIKQMEYIDRHGYRVIELDEYCRLRRAGAPVPKKSLVITFDDGHKDNLVAFEVLKRFNFPATFFIIVDKLNSPSYLSRVDIAQALENPKITIGSHTVSEAYLPSLGPNELSYEIRNSKAALEDLFSKTIKFFSYTIGGYNRQTLKEVELAGYLCACTTNRGFSKKLTPFTLRRIKITDRDRGVRLWAKLSGFYDIFRKPKHPY
ncbi:MAG: polysaccharide deacetylase family protein [Candidatus Omnitrophica bacterium]|nr:polysaccharide deacetylase family protein [Candidatus Omnitrophota bacterium]